MIKISYWHMLLFISVMWIIVRGIVFLREHKFSILKEAKLLLVYICLIVIARFVFFPFEKVNGQIMPLVFDAKKAFPPKVNLIPFVHLSDYVIAWQANLNLFGNIAMFVPVGIIWPVVFEKLDTPFRVILAGVAFSVTIEILQLPFSDRVSDIDDVILNSLGYITGYIIYLTAGSIKKLYNSKKASAE